MILKAGRPVIDLIKLCYSANRPVLLQGRHGIGKTELFQAAAAELGIEYICSDLSLMEPPDLVGLPVMTGGKTHYFPPSFLPTEGSGLLCFEELNRCEKYMRAPCLQLLTARCLNDYTLPLGWLPTAAINPTNGDYETDELDMALISRFVRVEVEPDVDEWLAWARAQANCIHPDVMSYVKSDPAIFDDPQSNPRAWVHVSDLLHAQGRAGSSDETVHQAVAGLIGAVRAEAFLGGRYKEGQPLQADDILVRYPRQGKRLRAWVEAGRLDLVRGSLHNLETRLQARGHYEQARRNAEHWANLSAFLADLPGDLFEQAMTFFDDREYDRPSPPRKRRR
jgi:MoxR-like ATPase